MVTVGIDLNKVYEYKIYVKTSYYEKNVISDEYNQISLTINKQEFSHPLQVVRWISKIKYK